MKVGVDHTACAVTGICESLVPEVFAVDVAGDLVVRDAAVPPEFEEGVRAAVESCPTRALRLAE